MAKSGREDLNLRPPEPHSGALAKLRHAPYTLLVSTIRSMLSRRASLQLPANSTLSLYPRQMPVTYCNRSRIDNTPNSCPCRTIGRWR